MGLGLGLVGSAFTLLNAYIFKPIDLPNPHALYALSWDSDTARRQRFRLADYEALQPEARGFAELCPRKRIRSQAPIPRLLVLVGIDKRTTLEGAPS